jgi:DNA mismatch endonuclease (patch repair protein)
MDIVDAFTRTRMMAGIRSKDTKPEMLVRQFLHARGFRYRLHAKNLPARPDIVLARYRVAILVHGCFWHRHARCTYSTTPSSNTLKWQTKFDQNMARDVRDIASLIDQDWNVIVIWECGLRGKDVATRLSWLPDAIKLPQSRFQEWPAPS